MKKLLYTIIFLTFSSSLFAKIIFDKDKNCGIDFEGLDNPGYYLYWTGKCENNQATGIGIAIVSKKSNGVIEDIYRFEGEVKQGKPIHTQVTRFYSDDFYTIINNDKSSTDKAFQISLDFKTTRVGTIVNNKFVTKNTITQTKKNANDYRKMAWQHGKHLFQHRQSKEIIENKLPCDPFFRKINLMADLHEQDASVNDYSHLIKCYNNLNLAKDVIATIKESYKFNNGKSKTWELINQGYLAKAYYLLKDYKQSFSHFMRLHKTTITKELYTMLQSKEFDQFDELRKPMLQAMALKFKQ